MANGDKGPRPLALINLGGTEALLDNKLPHWDMSEELDHPRKILELIGDWPMKDKDDEVDCPLRPPYCPP